MWHDDTIHDIDNTITSLLKSNNKNVTENGNIIYNQLLESENVIFNYWYPSIIEFCSFLMKPKSKVSQ